MKKLSFHIMTASALLLGISAMNSCSKVADIIDNITIPVVITVPLSFDAQIPLAITNTTDYVKYPEIPMNLDLDSQIKANYPSLSVNNIKSAKLVSFNIEYVSSTNNTKLNVIQNARIYIKTPELSELLIATADNNTSETTINFTPVPDVDISSYLKSKQNSLIFEIQGREIAADLLNIKINSSFRIEAGL